MSIDWEERYRISDTPWDKGASHPALVDFLREEKQQPLRGDILVPGCGTGYDVRAISRDDNVVTGIDIAPSAIQRAAAFPKVAHESYALVDLFDLPPRFRGAFDWVFEHTCFCAIEPTLRSRYVEAIADALKPNGHLLAVFFLNPDLASDEQGPPFGASVSELDDLFGTRFQLLHQWTPARTYEGREGREQMGVLQKRM